MEQSIFLQEYFKIIQYLYQLKNSGTTRIESWKPNGMSEENIENITKSKRILHQLLWIIMYYQT